MTSTPSLSRGMGKALRPYPCPASRTFSRRHRARRAGFTLMEVLAALLLIGIVLPVAMEGITRSVEAGSSAKRRAEAATLAEGKLNEVIILGSANLIDESGEFGPEWPGYMYAVTSQTQDYNDALGLIEVTVTVTWPERGDQRALKVTSLMVDANATTPASTTPSRTGGLQ